MPSRRGNGNPRTRAGKYRLPVVSFLLISVIIPLVYLAAQRGNFTSFGDKDLTDGIRNAGILDAKLIALQQIEKLFSKEVLDVIKLNSIDSGPLSLNVIRRKDLSSSWVLENPAKSRKAKADTIADKFNEVESGQHLLGLSNGSLLSGREGDLDVHEDEKSHSKQIEERFDKPEGDLSSQLISEQNSTNNEDAFARAARLRTRLERKDKRVLQLTQSNEAAALTLEKDAYTSKKEIDDNVLNKYSIWKPDFDTDSDMLVRLIRDQLIMARVYASLAHSHNMIDLQRELNVRIKESNRVLGEAIVDANLPQSVSAKIKAMGQSLLTARTHLYDCKAVTKKLRAMLQSSNDQALVLSKQSTVLRQLLAKTIPKGIHCLTMLLTSQLNSLSHEQRDVSSLEKLEDTSLYHYALFSDNVIAAGVVVNSTVQNAKEPEKHVFHLVSDKLNYAAMKMWFIANPPGKARVHVQNIEHFKWLNASYCPVLRQLQTASMREYYFKSDHSTTLADASKNLKYRNPKYLSMLNHLRFYLPEVYPKLDKILFLDDDIVVQRDLTPLWAIDLNGNVNGAVETCGDTFHRFDKYLNFSNPFIRKSFSPNACGWAYGMNMFDLQEWKKRDITGIYHRWQNLNERRELWKLGTLPPGLITFYNLTYPLDRQWHVLGLGYDPHIMQEDIESAAVVHYNGNMKPWLDISMSRYKGYWTKYVNHNDDFLRQCNVNM